MNDRKYRHRGYQDSSEEPRTRGPRPDALGRTEGAPRGRGADVDKAVVFACKACGEKRRDLEETLAELDHAEESCVERLAELGVNT